MTDRELMKQAVRVMGSIGADLICEVAHHEKKDRHELGEPCPVKQRFHEAFQNLRTAIEHAEKQEPVGEVLNERGEVDYISYVPPVGTPLYTAPRQWVGLTEDEVDYIWNRYCDEMGEASINDAEDIARAIEAKLKEKNNT